MNLINPRSLNHHFANNSVNKTNTNIHNKKKQSGTNLRVNNIKRKQQLAHQKNHAKKNQKCLRFQEIEVDDQTPNKFRSPWEKREGYK